MKPARLAGPCGSSRTAAEHVSEVLMKLQTWRRMWVESTWRGEWRRLNVKVFAGNTRVFMGNHSCPMSLPLVFAATPTFPNISVPFSCLSFFSCFPFCHPLLLRPLAFQMKRLTLRRGPGVPHTRSCIFYNPVF